MTGFIKITSGLLASLLAIYEMIQISGIFNVFHLFIPSPIHLGISLLVVILLLYLHSFQHFSGMHPTKKIIGYASNIMLMLFGVIGSGFVIFFYRKVLEYGNYGYLDNIGMVMAILIAITLLESVRRTMGWSLPIIILVLFGMTYFQNYLPGNLHGRGTTLDTLTYNYFVGTGGIFGIPFHIAVNILFPFIVFGTLFHMSGAGKWLMDLAISLTGRSTGGPAKASVIGSALVGTISGTVGGNVATSGNFTIPLMKRIGYTPAYAAAVEATASVGGAVMPPVMGATAFVMAEFLGVPYYVVALSALIPALIYFAVVFFSVQFRAKKMGLPVMSKEELPSIRTTLRTGWYNFIPIAALLYFLFILRTNVEIAALAAIPFIILTSFLKQDRGAWLTPKRILSGLMESVHFWIPVAMITAAVGMLVGALELSGLGHLFADFIIELGSGYLPLTLLMVALASFILGMGLDGVPLYLTLVVLTAPALIQMGLSDMQAHMFIFYTGLLSFITPPVCIAVFIACGISGSKVWETGWEACRIGAALFLVPFAFAYQPALLMEGTVIEIIAAAAFAFVGAIVLAAALQGYSIGPMNIVYRGLFFAGGLLLLTGNAYYIPIGFVIVGVILLLQWKDAANRTMIKKSI